MSKKLLSFGLAVIILLSVALPAFAASSLADLIAKAPTGAREFNADGASGNGLNGPVTLWWDYHPETQTGDVWMLVASNNAGKIGTAAQLGGKAGIIIDGVEKKNANNTAYTLIKFVDVWLTGEEDFDVSMNNDGSFKGGQWISGNLRDYFPQLVNVTYFGPDGARLGADTLLALETTTVWSWVANTGYVFLYWIDDDGNTYEAGEIITVDSDLNLYAVEDADTFGYKVEYYYDGVLDASKTYTASASFGSVVVSYPPQDKLGYKLVDDTAPLTITELASNNVIYVYYKADYDDTNKLSYTVEYYKDADKIATDPFSEDVWVAAPQVLTVQTVDRGKYLPLGYKFDRADPAPIPATIADGGVIKVYYVPDYTLTNKLSYTVEYYKDADKIAADPFSEDVWVAAPQVLTVQTVDTGKYLPLGYKFDRADPAPIPATIADGGVIKVYYAPDYTLTNKLSYTVEYYKDDVNIATDPFTQNVWVAAPQVLTVQTVDTGKYLPLGYKFDRADPAPIPATIADGGVIKVYYVPDYNDTNELSYTVEYYKDDIVLVGAETIKREVWVGDPQVIVVEDVDITLYKPDGYEFDYTVPGIDTFPVTLNDGGVIKVYYVKVIFTVTYSDGGVGVFADEIFYDLSYGDDTPAYTVDVERQGFDFIGWEPAVAATVTEDVVYVAQWEQIKYKVEFLLGDPNMGDELDGQKVYFPVYYGDEMPEPPHPYAKFSYKFLGWKGDDGSFVAAPDYRAPTTLEGYPETVTGSVTYTAQWAQINPDIVFPDKIPSVAHFDRWWGDYGIICFAASTTKSDEYSMMFADWFFDVFRSCTIGFGSPGKIQYEVLFEEDGTTMWQITGNSKKQITNKGEIGYFYDMTCVNDGMYFTKDKNHDYGLDYGMNGYMQGVSFINPFGSGSMQAWLY